MRNEDTNDSELAKQSPQELDKVPTILSFRRRRNPRKKLDKVIATILSFRGTRNPRKKLDKVATILSSWQRKDHTRSSTKFCSFI